MLILEQKAIGWRWDLTASLFPKVWIFDTAGGGGRLLRSRLGHSAPPSKIRHYGQTGHHILSAGREGRIHVTSKTGSVIEIHLKSNWGAFDSVQLFELMRDASKSDNLRVAVWIWDQISTCPHDPYLHWNEPQREPVETDAPVLVLRSGWNFTVLLHGPWEIQQEPGPRWDPSPTRAPMFYNHG